MSPIIITWNGICYTYRYESYAVPMFIIWLEELLKWSTNCFGYRSLFLLPSIITTTVYLRWIVQTFVFVVGIILQFIGYEMNTSKTINWIKFLLNQKRVIMPFLLIFRISIRLMIPYNIVQWITISCEYFILLDFRFLIST